jgi:hypothetical protein
VLDVTGFTKTQLAEAVKLFDLMRGQELLSLHEIDKDVVRKQLDEKFSLKVLGLPKKVVTERLELLRLKLSREPTIRGKK